MTSATTFLPQEPYPSPPSYDEAIGRSLQSHQALGNQSTNGLTPHDFGTFNGSSGYRRGGGDDDERDMEEERDYEESRPLKMGRIPDTRAQYTFIQPNDTINPSHTNSTNNRRSSHQHQGQSPNIQNRYPGHQHNSSMIQQQQPYAPPPTSPLFNIPTAPPAPGPAPILAPLAPNISVPSLSSKEPSKNIHQQQIQPENNVIECTVEPTSSSSSYFAPMAAPVPLAGVPEIAGNGLINPQDISIADFKQTKRGTESCDMVLEDPYQLYRYFVAHNDRPTMHVVIAGHHIEKHETFETDSDGHRKPVTRNVRVDDFKIDFDLTPYISPRGTLYTAPDPKTGKTLTIREALEQYAEDENPFKEMHMHKMVAWDFEELTRAITHAIRSVHYRYTIEVSYPCTNNVVIAKSSAPLAVFMRNGWTKAFCFLSLVGIIFYPARELYKKVKDKILKSEFEMTISTRDFYTQNYWSIVDQVQYR
ncbi:hypothetical protein BX616_005969 [Lobosporangium transversale]|uniref:Uncharacterized protein n=1 Tax=Lobosporangium transversale TaxID=64571 RepID=A0A1Y2GF33_9FUNG|nr:hypothetical protein BCR41DRAFT_340302 [Lobosporangium transversale]KAF9897227.1 hypothetical protein BX616_005969 [Lobosporangium transversale]ORZ07238.1 hypothetical protein BCR41DRAFT_340302 [Lobosporangium transversale]|eukprot:XP_021877901.1 hypothetical protein BCR41DRAFT_340302 [Lobosporangium transversale]